MKKILSLVITLSLLLVCVAGLASCGGGITVAIPNDTTNEARALRLLEVQGLIKLSDSTKETLTPKDVTENPYNIKFKEVEAAQIPSILNDVDYAVINSNYAIEAGLTPFVTEGTNVSYPDIIAVKDGTQNSDKIKALVAAVNSAAVKAYIETQYKGAIVCDLTNPDLLGVDTSVNYAALAGTEIKVAASPTPHADILKQAKALLAVANITLTITEFNDYVQPNMVVESGEYDANYFQHVPYLEDFNAENGTHIKSVLEVHHEPMGVYSAKYDSFDAIKNPESK
jgi:D-methionine transport system substrate-binding protein